MEGKKESAGLHEWVGGRRLRRLECGKSAEPHAAERALRAQTTVSGACNGREVGCEVECRRCWLCVTQERTLFGKARRVEEKTLVVSQDLTEVQRVR